MPCWDASVSLFPGTFMAVGLCTPLFLLPHLLIATEKLSKTLKYTKLSIRCSQSPSVAKTEPLGWVIYKENTFMSYS